MIDKIGGLILSAVIGCLVSTLVFLMKWRESFVVLKTEHAKDIEAIKTNIRELQEAHVRSEDRREAEDAKLRDRFDSLKEFMDRHL